MQALNQCLKILVLKGLMSLDLLTTWMARRVQPLQLHMDTLGEWSLSMDHTQTTTQELRVHEQEGWVWSILTLPMDHPFKPGLSSYAAMTLPLW